MAGFGVAGAKNIYTTRAVRAGNWYEDQKGEDLVRRSQVGPARFAARTEAQDHFIQPRKMSDRAGLAHSRVSMPPQPGASVPSHMIFSHGVQAHDRKAGGEGQFVTMSQLLHSGTGLRPTDAVALHPPPVMHAAMKEATRTERVVKRAKDVRAGVAPTDPRGAKSDLKVRAAPEVSGDPFMTTSRASSKLVDREVRLARGRAAAAGGGHSQEPATLTRRRKRFTESYKPAITGLRS